MAEVSSYSVEDVKGVYPFNLGNEASKGLCRKFSLANRQVRKEKIFYVFMTILYLGIVLTLVFNVDKFKGWMFFVFIPLIGFCGFMLFSLLSSKIVYDPKYEMEDPIDGLTKEQATGFIYDLMYYFCQKSEKVALEDLKTSYKAVRRMSGFVPGTQSMPGAVFYTDDYDAGYRNMLAENEAIRRRNDETLKSILNKRDIQLEILRKIGCLYDTYIR